jgi:hypothetical protein
VSENEPGAARGGTPTPEPARPGDAAAPGDAAPNDAIPGDAAASGAIHGGPAARRPKLLGRLPTAVLTVGVVAIVTATVLHLTAVFFSIAPTNPISTTYQSQLNAWIYPYFEQDWKLFAPNPVSENYRIYARVRTASSQSGPVSDWYDLTAVDYAQIKDNPFPSHTTQNMLRRAWSLYPDTHDGQDRPISERGRMLGDYLRNIAVARITKDFPVGSVRAIQLRVDTTPVPAPAGQTSSGAKPSSQTLSWWPVPAASG